MGEVPATRVASRLEGARAASKSVRILKKYFKDLKNAKTGTNPGDLPPGFKSLPAHLGDTAIIMMQQLPWQNFFKDTAGNRFVARRYHYVCQGTALNEYKFEWIGTKFQQADLLTKPGTPEIFGHLSSIQLLDINDHHNE